MFGLSTLRGGSCKLDAEVIRKTHPRSIVAFNKAVGLGLGEKVRE
jgi:hypothetical protein